VGLSALLVAIAAPAAAQSGDAMKIYREKTQAKITCRETAADDEIIVCGLRAADRYRTPIVQRTPGDPKILDVPAERERLIARSTPCQDRGPFLIGCGMVGASASTAIGPGGGKPTLRTPAP
jgi:hypothetical protein